MNAPALPSEWPRIALVTPVFNAVKYIEGTIQSVLGQKYPNLDYYVVDGGSTDGTVEIIKKYEKQISGWISEPDKGMYDAINKGFARTTGEIMGWINATDMMQVGGLSVVGSVFRDLPQVEWITGRATIFSEEGMTVKVLPAARWSRNRFLAGANRTVQQESTYWRRSLWDRAGGFVDTTSHAAGDFELWVRFFRHAPLHSVDAVIAGWRSHPNGFGQGDMGSYFQSCEEVLDREPKGGASGRWANIVRRANRRLRTVPVVRGVWRILVMESLYHRNGPDWTPVIEFKWGKVTKWGLRSK